MPNKQFTDIRQAIERSLGNPEWKGTYYVEIRYYVSSKTLEIRRKKTEDEH